jgi:hypothetical protein
VIPVDPDRLAKSDTLARVVRAQEAVSQLHVAVGEELQAWRGEVDRLRAECRRLEAECAGLRGLADALRAECDDWKAKWLRDVSGARSNT